MPPLLNNPPKWWQLFDAHTQQKHQANLAMRAATEAKDSQSCFLQQKLKLFMSAYEQKIETHNRDWQYLVIAAEPYEIIVAICFQTMIFLRILQWVLAFYCVCFLINFSLYWNVSMTMPKFNGADSSMSRPSVNFWFFFEAIWVKLAKLTFFYISAKFCSI